MGPPSSTKQERIKKKEEMTEEALSPMDALAALLAPSEEEKKAVAAVMGGGGAFLGYVQFMSSNNNKVKSGEIPVKTFCYNQGGQMEQLGTAVDVLILASRSTAVDNSGEKPVFCHDPALDEKGNFTGVFKQIVDDSDKKDSNCFFGPEYLLWIPQIEKFATFLMGSLTARNDAHTLQSLVAKAATLTSHMIPNKKYGPYPSPIAEECNTVFEMPEPAVILEQVEKFKNPPQPKVEEAASEDEAEATDREQ